MSFSFKILDKAQLEFEDAVLWYELRNTGLGKRFSEIVLRKFSLIEKYPERYPIRKNSFRETPLKVFPFLIIYKYYNQRNEIVIYRVFNWRKNPLKKYRK